MSLLHNRAKRWICNALLLLLAAGCAGRLPPPEAGGFVLRGKLAVVEGDQSVSARFLWRQSGDRFAIDLWGPMGQGQMRLEGDREELVLRDASGAVATRGPHESVMTAQLGWSLPLAVLPDWVQGRPYPGIPVSETEQDASGRLAAFRQLDWHVHFDRFRPVSGAPADAPEATERPHQVDARRGIYRVRLAISEWQF